MRTLQAHSLQTFESGWWSTPIRVPERVRLNLSFVFEVSMKISVQRLSSILILWVILVLLVAARASAKRPSAT